MEETGLDVAHLLLCDTALTRQIPALSCYNLVMKDADSLNANDVEFISFSRDHQFQDLIIGQLQPMKPVIDLPRIDW